MADVVDHDFAANYLIEDYIRIAPDDQPPYSFGIRRMAHFRKMRELCD
jgi:hypothetical protein